MPDPLDTPIENPLDIGERAVAAGALLRLADMLEADPVCEELDMPADEQRARAAKAVSDARTTAGALAHERIEFDRAASARNLISLLSGDLDSEDSPAQIRTLKAAAAKLDEACERMIPARLRAFKAASHAELTERGFRVQHVLGHGEPLPVPSFSYTIGLAEYDHSELAIVGLDPSSAQAILQALAGEVKAGRRLAGRERIAGMLTGELELLAVQAPGSLVGELRLAYRDGEPPAALQIMWPDEQGRLSDEPDVDEAVVAAQSFPSHPSFED